MWNRWSSSLKKIKVYNLENVESIVSLIPDILIIKINRHIIKEHVYLGIQHKINIINTI